MEGYYMAFKDSFSKITKSLSESASSVVHKSNDMMEIGKLNVEIDNEEKKKDIIFIVLVKLIYNSYINKTELSEDINNKCQAIIEYDEQIKKINSKIFNVKKIKKCFNCEVDMNIDINFCPNCGKKQELIINNNSPQFSESIREEDRL
jgi:hypothetical protein